MTSNHNAKTCKQRLLCGICKSTIQQECMLMSRTEENTESKDGTKDTVKCASVKGKIDTEVIHMCVVPVWVGHSLEKWSRHMLC